MLKDLDLKTLRKLLQLCRSQGVAEFEIENIKFKLGDLQEDVKSPKVIAEDELMDNFKGLPTDEELMFYHVGGLAAPSMGSFNPEESEQ